MNAPQLEALRVRARRLPSWEVHCGGHVWYISAANFLEAIATWRREAYIPPGCSTHNVKARIAFGPSRT